MLWCQLLILFFVPALASAVETCDFALARKVRASLHTERRLRGEKEDRAKWHRETGAGAKFRQLNARMLTCALYRQPHDADRLLDLAQALRQELAWFPDQRQDALDELGTVNEVLVSVVLDTCAKNCSATVG